MREHGRRRILTRLAERGVHLDEQLLLQFEALYRTQAHEKPTTDPSTFSGTPPDGPAIATLDELAAVFRRHLLIADPDLLAVLVGAVLAHRLGGEPVWLLVVGPPGSTKSELLRSLYAVPGLYPLSELTARTLASGLDTPNGDASLLARLADEILVLKDLTTVLQVAHDERQAIFAQLREVYDGRFDKAWGTGRELHWTGRLGFIAGVTEVIDQHQAALAVLGERFVLFRPTLPDRQTLAEAALAGVGNEDAMRAELAGAMRRFLASRRLRRPRTPPHVVKELARLADCVTRARSAVLRDGYRRELEYAPEPEAPTRFAKVLLNLAGGLAVAQEAREVGELQLLIVARVAFDSLPAVRRRVLSALLRGDVAADGAGGLSTSALAGAVRFSTRTMRRALEDLEALGVVDCSHAGLGRPDTWSLRREFRTVLRGATPPLPPAPAPSLPSLA